MVILDYVLVVGDSTPIMGIFGSGHKKAVANRIQVKIVGAQSDLSLGFCRYNEDVAIMVGNAPYGTRIQDGGIFQGESGW
jgi:hypothetical protein